MAFWSGETIRARNQRSPEIIRPFDAEAIDCNAYTLHLGREAFVTSHRFLKRYEEAKKILQPGDSFYIPAGQFAFLLSKEYLTVPVDVMAFTSLRSRIKYRGLVNVSGFHVDPGFRGHFLYAVYNAGPQPIVLNEGDPLFLIWFAELDCKTTLKSRVNREPQTTIDSGIIQQVSGPILSLQELTERMRLLDNSVYHVKAAAAVAVTFLVFVVSCLRCALA
jgi:dCTP deaminase